MGILDGQVAIVTGCGRMNGLGRGIATRSRRLVPTWQSQIWSVAAPATSANPATMRRLRVGVDSKAWAKKSEPSADGRCRSSAMLATAAMSNA